MNSFQLQLQGKDGCIRMHGRQTAAQMSPAREPLASLKREPANCQCLARNHSFSADSFCPAAGVKSRSPLTSNRENIMGAMTSRTSVTSTKVKLNVTPESPVSPEVKREPVTFPFEPIALPPGSPVYSVSSILKRIAPALRSGTATQQSNEGSVSFNCIEILTLLSKGSVTKSNCLNHCTLLVPTVSQLLPGPAWHVGPVKCNGPATGSSSSSSSSSSNGAYGPTSSQHYHLASVLTPRGSQVPWQADSTGTPKLEDRGQGEFR